MNDELTFLVSSRNSKNTAHIWLINDTACSMWSTGGLPRTGYVVSPTRIGRKICKMCVHCFERDGGHIPKERKKLSEAEISRRIEDHFGRDDKRPCPPEMITAIGLITDMRQSDRLRTYDALNAFMCIHCGTDRLPCHNCTE